VVEMRMNVSPHILKRDGVLRRQAMIAWQDDNQWLHDDDRYSRSGICPYRAHGWQVKFPAEQSARELR